MSRCNVDPMIGVLSCDIVESDVEGPTVWGGHIAPKRRRLGRRGPAKLLEGAKRLSSALPCMKRSLINIIHGRDDMHIPMLCD
eukprot:134957-Lingulodinium_polyedra.AAC.1